MAPARCGALNRGELRERGLPCFPFTPREAWEAFRAPPGGPCHTEGVNPRAITSLDFSVVFGLFYELHSR